MKKSQYTTVLKNGEDEYVMYNSLHDKVLVCSPELMAVLNGLDHVDLLEEIHPTFYRRLCDDQFIIPNEVDEVEQVVKKIVEEDDADTHYSITINPTLNCNLRCWYCYEEHLANSNMSQEVFEATKKKIKTICENGKTKSLNLSFFGGEPLLGFRKCVKPLIEFTQSICEKSDILFTIGFTTNAVLLTQEVADFLEKTGVHILLQIPFDGDRDMHNSIKKISDGSGTYDITLANVKRILAKKNVSVIIRCNYTQKSAATFDKLIDDIAPLYADYGSQLEFGFHKVWQDIENKDTEQIIRSLEKKINQLGGDYHEPSVSSTRCYADKRHSFVINYNGDVYQCTARNFTDENKDGRLLVDGTIEYNERYKERMKSRFSNPDCMKCRVFPICRICTQKRMENDNTKCIYANSLDSQEGMIRSRISAGYKISRRRRECE